LQIAEDHEANKKANKFARVGFSAMSWTRGDWGVLAVIFAPRAVFSIRFLFNRRLMRRKGLLVCPAFSKISFVSDIAFGGRPVYKYKWPSIDRSRRHVMTTVALTSGPPSREDAELARASGQRLAPLARRDRALTLRVRDAGEETTIELPAGAVKLLLAILEDMASGRAVTIVPQNAELTTQQAADFLNVSRPFLVDLLERKKLPFRLVGTHRRIRFEDVLNFKENIDAERRIVLDQLAAQAQELKLGY
jgi:excisionase family DNA binding protein